MKFAIDKQAHFWWGWAIAATLYQVVGLPAAVVAAFSGLVKELWDKKGNGTPDIEDFFATTLGGFAGIAVSWGCTLLTN